MSEISRIYPKTCAPEIRNIKAHFRINSEDIPRITLSPQETKSQELSESESESAAKVKLYHNFFVLRYKFVYNVFPQSGFVNVTKLKKNTDIHLCVEKFCEYFSLKRESISGTLTIDNITLSGKFEKELNLQNIAERLCPDFQVKYDINFFPGLFMKFSQLGTILLFRTGSYSIVGCKKVSDSQTIFLKLCAIINM